MERIELELDTQTIGDMWRDLLVLNQPPEHLCASVAGIAHQPLWLHIKASLHPFNHPAGRIELVRARIENTDFKRPFS